MVRWKGSRRSGNIQDRRGSRAVRAGGIGGGAGLVVLVIYALLGGNPLELLQMAGGGQGAAPAGEVQPDSAPPTDEMGAYLSAILAMTEDVWSEIFAASGEVYQEPILVLFTESVQSACGYATAATGPFYCPPDQNLYLDTGFFEELARMGGAGDFAVAYVVGHEVGHHVQTLTGISNQVRARQQRSSQTEVNRLQVLMELQADCYSGVWAHHANRRLQILEPGDIEEGLAAAAAIGDDRLQRRAGRTVSPESFTHGSSAQRREWLERGLRDGDVALCDTFAEAGRLSSAERVVSDGPSRHATPVASGRQHGARSVSNDRG